MSAGDAGLERQMADAEYQTICGWVTKYGWLNAAMAERVRQLLHRQQAVVDAARELGGLIDGYRWSSHSHDRAVRETNERMRQALAALDTAQAAQPEGERTR